MASEFASCPPRQESSIPLQSGLDSKAGATKSPRSCSFRLTHYGSTLEGFLPLSVAQSESWRHFTTVGNAPYFTKHLTLGA
jgi:hypothetical protein